MSGELLLTSAPNNLKNELCWESNYRQTVILKSVFKVAPSTNMLLLFIKCHSVTQFWIYNIKI